KHHLQGTPATPAKPVPRRVTAPAGGKNWEPAHYNPELNLTYIPSSEGCNQLEGKVQADFADQGGTVQPRERFTGGSGKPLEQTPRSLKTPHPGSGGSKAVARPQPPHRPRGAATRGPHAV